MFINYNPQHFSQIGCHINTPVYLEIPVLGRGTLVLPLRKKVFRTVYMYVLKVVYYVPLY
jgi:hypothetical protein